VILPESTLADADQLFQRLQEAVTARPIGQAGRLSFSAGVTELGSDDNPTVFFERADQALYRAKERGKAQVVSSNATA
jgi:GGDEF domain-containing protein